MEKTPLLILFLILTQLACEPMPKEIKLKTHAASDIMATSATLHGEITDIGEGIIDYGHCWAEHSDPETTDFSTSFDYIDDTYSIKSEIENLEPTTKYYFRVWAEGDDGIIKFGNVLDFTTSDGKATVTTNGVTDVSVNSAQCGGSITSAGGSEVVLRGVCWNTSGSPKVNDNKTEDGSGLGSFTSDIGGLSHDSEYYVRAYAITKVDTAYGSQKYFKTHDGIIELTTNNITNITVNSAISGGNIIDDGGSPVTARGVCWSTSPDPKIIDNKTIDGSGIGIYTSGITGLSNDQQYYVRAYAINSVDTSYGGPIDFTTLDGIPLVTTEAVTEIDATTAQSGGDVTEDWGSTITRRGIVWDTDPEPTLEDCEGYTEDGVGTGTFSSTLVNLSCTTYYCRAYAENEYGTGYGENEIEFTTYLKDTRDGNKYKWVEIGDQIWMAENLAYLPSLNGYSVYGYKGTDVEQARNASNYETYGVLYNWWAAVSACPDGWHLPSHTECTELENYLADNGYNYDGTTGGEGDKIAKAMAADHGWQASSNEGAVGNIDYPEKRNASGFTALPGGIMHLGFFSGNGESCTWWSATEFGTEEQAYKHSMYFDGSYVHNRLREIEFGYSVRCVKD